MIDELRRALADTLGALGLEGTDAQRNALLRYLDLLQRWNAVYNLTAVREPRAMLVQHLADCLAVIAPMQRALTSNTGRVLDVGSGGGLPAVVIAIMLPTVRVTSVDTVGKKTAFVRQVVAELRLANLDAVQTRVERFEAEPFDLVVSRAFASLKDFVASTRHLLGPDGRWMAMKGRYPEAEIAELPFDIEMFHVEHLAVPGLDAERCLIWMRPVTPSL